MRSLPSGELRSQLPTCPLDGTDHRTPSVFRASICPFQDCIQRWTERLSTFGQSVFHLRWNLGICGAIHNAVGLHAFQLLPQHLLCDAGNCALKVGKTHNLAPEEMKENDELPSAFEQTQRCFNIGSGRGGCVALRHLASLTYFFVRTSHYRSLVKNFYQCNYGGDS